jgi:hypothetical protein
VNAIVSTDLWFPGRWELFGWPHAVTRWRPGDLTPDPTRYVVWVNPGRGRGELAPRTALHLAECRNGSRS